MLLIMTNIKVGWWKNNNLFAYANNFAVADVGGKFLINVFKCSHSTHEFRQQTGIPMSHSAVRSRMVQFWLKSHRSKRKILISAVNKLKHLQFAQQHLNWAESQWRHVLLTYKTPMSLVPINQPPYVGYTTSERYLPDYLKLLQENLNVDEMEQTVQFFSTSKLLLCLIG